MKPVSTGRGLDAPGAECCHGKQWDRHSTVIHTYGVGVRPAFGAMHR